MPDEPAAPRTGAARRLKHWRKGLFVLAGLLFMAAVAVGLAMGWLKYYIDGRTINQRAHEAVLRHVLWEEPEPVENRLNQVRGNREATLSPDRRTVVFSREYSPGDTELFIQRRVDGTWSEPERLQTVNSPAHDRGPAFSPDGKRLYFFSNREGGHGGHDLWVSRREGSGWLPAENVGEAVNTRDNEIWPAPDTGGAGLYFASDRGGEATDFDLFLARFATDPSADTTPGPQNGFEAARAMGALNSPAYEGKAASAARGDILYFVSGREGGLGGRDLYRSLRVNGRFEAPRNLGAPVNTPMDEAAPTADPDGFRIYFNSNRLSPTGRDFNLFQAVSREVLIRIDYDLLRYLLVCLLLAAIALLAINYLLQLLFDSQGRIIPRCLVASLLLHIILLALSGTWYLRSKIQDVLDPGPPEMTINVNALARESIGLAIRESVGALPAVEGTNAANLPAPAWEAPARAPKTAPTPVEAAVADAGESAPSPLKAEVFSQVRASEPAVSEVSPRSFHEPFEVGPTSVAMEAMPKGTTRTGDPEASGEEASAPSEASGAHAGTNTTPMRIQGAGSTGPVSVAAPAVDGATPATEALASSATSDTRAAVSEAFQGERNESRSHDARTARALAEATGASARANAAGSLGSFALPAGLAMEGRAGAGDRRAPDLGLLGHDPHRIEPDALEVIESRSRRFYELLRGGKLPVPGPLALSAFAAIEHERSVREPGEVGEVVGGAMPMLLIPADSELEIPEAYLP